MFVLLRNYVIIPLSVQGACVHIRDATVVSPV